MSTDSPAPAEALGASVADSNTPNPPNIPAEPREIAGSGAPIADLFDTTNTFETLRLRNSVLKGVTEAGFKYPTLVQGQLIPHILAGKDVMGQAKTGSGKTASFGLPLLHLCNKELAGQALILCPTRELAIQICAEIDELGKHTPIKACAIYGGDNIRSQLEELKQGPQILVGTPGRVMDFAERGNIHFKNVKFAVLDEVDRMLDIGFRDDIKKILDQCPPPGERQTIMVSATISDDIERLARKQMKDPEKVVVIGKSLVVSQVKQYHLPVNPWDKKKLLLHLLRHEEPALTLIFCNQKRTVDEIATGLSKRGIEAHSIHGDHPQRKRNKTMERLREGELSVLVCSDLASRGIDVEGISHVINFDLPLDPELYVHRIGRTARAGREGVAWSLVTPADGELLTQVEMLTNTEVPKLEYPDFIPSERPEGWREDSAPRMRPQTEAAPPPEEPRTSFVRQPATSGAGPASGSGSGSGSGQSGSQTPAAPAPAPVVVAKPDPAKFPGGIIPIMLPPKRMQGRVTRR